MDNKKELEDDYDCLVQNSEATRRKMRLIEEKVQELERGIDTNRKKIEETEAEERKMASNYEFEKNKIVKIESIAIPKLNVIFFVQIVFRIFETNQILNNFRRKLNKK